MEKGSRIRFDRLINVEYQEKRAKIAAKDAVKSGKDKAKVRLVRRAASAEKMTQRRQNVTATRNSGRTNKDGDHDFLGKIGLDTKLQTQNINPVINMAELAKISIDAQRAGKPIGVLVLRNKFNAGVVVLSEADWGTILQWLSPE